MVPLQTEEQKAYALELASKGSGGNQGDEVSADFPAELKDVLEDWSFETEADKTGIWLHSMNGGIDAVCLFVQHLLQKFDPEGTIAFEWSNDCSKPRIDAFGGGAAFITASKIISMNTSDWLRLQTTVHETSPKNHQRAESKLHHN
jgi:hypothetical protein